MEMVNKHGLRQALPVMEGWLRYQMYIREIPGTAVGLFAEDEVIFNNAYGFADIETKEKLTNDHLFRVASHSKLFTATAIMRLYHEGKLSLDDKVSKHLPWFKSEEDCNLQDICIHHLLTHTSGIISDGLLGHWRERKDFTKEDLQNLVRSGISIYKTSEMVKYSNLGYTLLGSIIEVVTGRSYSEYIQETILTPLGMNNTYTDITPENSSQHARGYMMHHPRISRNPLGYFPAKILKPAYGFSSNVEDLITFYQAHMLGNTTILPDSLKREMQRVQVQLKGGKRGLAFAIANYSNEEEVYYHSGGHPGYKSLSGLNQKDNVILVLLINTSDGPNFSWFNAIFNLFSNLEKRWKEFRSPEGVDTPDYSSFTGYYVYEIGVTMISQVGAKLVMVSPESDSPYRTLQVLKPIGDNRFITPSGSPFSSPGETITFMDGPDGEKLLVDIRGIKIEKFRIPEL